MPPVKPSHTGYDAPDAQFVLSWHQRVGAFARAAMGVQRTGNVLILGVTVRGNICFKTLSSCLQETRLIIPVQSMP